MENHFFELEIKFGLTLEYESCQFMGRIQKSFIAQEPSHAPK